MRRRRFAPSSPPLPPPLTSDALIHCPAGGWFNKEPPGWQRATAISFGVMGLCAAVGFSVSSARERRPTPPLWHIPSQGWSAYAKVDDETLK